jgi:hypothetical protein
VFRLSLLFVGVLLLFAGASCRKPAPPPQPVISPEEERRAAFRIITTLLIRIDGYLARLKNPELKASAQASAEALKNRHEALRSNFSLLAWEELRLDATLDAQRLAAWIAEEEQAMRDARATKGK